MHISHTELISVLVPFNPWWRNYPIADLPQWKRSAFHELIEWLIQPPVHRAVMLSGPRQVGKTTLLLQAVEHLIQQGVPTANIVYVTFDHPIFKLAGLEAVLEAWRQLEPKQEGPEYLFLDEAQFIKDFGTWTKHQIDFFKPRKIVFTGSAMPLVHNSEESGVGRWHVIPISTLSFYEYLQIKKINLPHMPPIAQLHLLWRSSPIELYQFQEASQILIGHFHEYLIRGGFPQTAVISSIMQAQRLLREDIIDKVLKRDMTALFGVRRVLELEQTFIYLCMHGGGIQDLQTLSSNLGIPKQTVQNFIHLLELTHFLYRLPPFGYGKEILRARYKLYLVDPAIAPAILMKDKTLLEDTKALGGLVETAVFAHIKAHSNLGQARCSYWKDPKNKELDLVIETSEGIIPLEIKYESKPITAHDVPGLLSFCRQRAAIRCGYVLTKAPQDVGLLQAAADDSAVPVMRIPAALFCYWIGAAESQSQGIL